MVNSTRHAVNRHQLDRLVAQALVPEAPFLACMRQIRLSIESGNAHDAIQAIDEQCSGLFEADSRYRFALECHQFIEKSQTRGENDHASIQYLRALAPKAMESFDPEAYPSFKSLLPCLILPLDDASATSLEFQRKTLASSIYHACLQQQPLDETQAFNPLVLLLVYVGRIYLASPPSAPLSNHEERMRDLITRILPYPIHKDAGPFPPMIESGSVEVKEAEVQALLQCCGCSRREAVEGITRSSGNVVRALKIELSRIHIDSKLIQELLDEYSQAHGLSDPAPLGEKGSASSVRQNLILHSPLRSQSRSPPQKVMRSSPKEDQEAFDLTVLKDLGRTNRADQVEGIVEELDPAYWADRQEVLFEFRCCWFTNLMKEGKHSEAFVYSRSHLSPLASKNPVLQASLQRVSSAMMPSFLSSSIVSQTGSSKFQSLLSSLIINLQANLKRRASPLQSPTTNKGNTRPKETADGDKMSSDADPPNSKLIDLLDFLLAHHSSWCAKERFPNGHCPFFLALGINLLREEEASPRNLGVRSSDDDDDDDEEYSSANEEDAGEDAEPNEEFVLRIMEILELPRSAAIDLLTLHNGDPEAAIYAVFG